MNFEIYNKGGLDLALTSLQPFPKVDKSGLDLAPPFPKVDKSGLDLALTSLQPFPKVDGLTRRHIWCIIMISIFYERIIPIYTWRRHIRITVIRRWRESRANRGLSWINV